MTNCSGIVYKVSRSNNFSSMQIIEIEFRSRSRPGCLLSAKLTV